MPRIAAISFVIFSFGSTPPLPGFAPCASLISTILTCGSARIAAAFSIVEPAIRRAAAELRGPNLIEDVAVALYVIRRQRALTRAHVAPGHLGAAREGPDRVR